MEPSFSELTNTVHRLKKELDEAETKLKERLEKLDKDSEEKKKQRAEHITRGELEYTISSLEQKFNQKLREISIGIDGSGFAPYTETNSTFN